MQGKTVLITGATAGIGLKTAEALAAKGATLLIAGRDPEKTERTAAALRGKGGAVTHFVADFSILAEVRRLAGEVRANTDRLHVLVNNAGAMFAQRQESADGFELTFAVNHLAPFLLTNLLLDTLKASAPARIVTVASSAHAQGSMDFDDLQFRQGWGPMKSYSRSKLANVMFAFELARRAAGTGITSNALDPGFVASSLGNNNKSALGVALRFAKLFANSPENGAKTSVHLASAPGVNGQTGQYFAKSQPAPSSKLSHDETAWRRLWDMSAEMAGL
ncbi:MAG: SDR family oxidoreductase [Proteobacteria bacterium]|nr:SDR family oxidoreductase [Pseudomonadota bacterium]